MSKENIIVIIVLIVLVAVLIYAITLINKPGGKIIKNLTEPQVNNSENQVSPADNLAPKPGDEKLVKKDVKVGDGAEVKAGDTVSVNYIGTFEDGTEFDNSYKRGEPFDFMVGTGGVIRGWDIGLLGMKVGGKRELVIPPELAYGETGAGPIPANATLKFVIELLSTKNVGDQPIKINP